MQKTIFIISVLLTSFVFVKAQDNMNAYKFDEFSSLQESDWKQKLDRFSESLVSQPDAKLHIIVFSELGKSKFTIQGLLTQYENYLEEKWKITPIKLSLEYGGYRDVQTTELWTVPYKAEYPTSVSAEKIAGEIVPELFYKFGTGNEQQLKAIVDGYFVNWTNKGLNGELVIITYESTELPGQLKSTLKQLNYLLKFKCIPHQITFIDGGFRKNMEIEFWIVPEGAAMPKPTKLD